MSDEFTRIARYFAPLAGAEGRGLADDAAVLTPLPGHDLVLTVDQMQEGVHFLSGDVPDLIAQKLLRRNLSDLAAMGATPLGYLLAMALPISINDFWLEAFCEGLRLDQKLFDFKLFGGDSSSSKSCISLSATLFGTVEHGKALSRSGAKLGDEIWVTGTIGDAALGLQARLGQRMGVAETLINRSLLPEPRIGLSLAGIASAVIDVSDGLLQDLGHICRAGTLGAVINAHDVPASSEAAAFGADVLEARLTDGDDYELLLAVPPANVSALKAACGDLRITRIGVFVADGPIQVLDNTGKALHFAKAGWQHF